MPCNRYHRFVRSIQEHWGRIKGHLDRGAGEWGIPVIVLLVGLASFGLGRFSALDRPKTAISEAQTANTASAAMALGGLVVASRTGSAYHYPWCGGADSIKESNKIWFKDEDAARAAGYSPAKNCKGLGTVSSQ